MNGTGSVLLDTSIVVDFLRRHDQSLIRELEGIPELYSPLTALGELLYGGYKSQDREQQNDIWIAAMALEHNLPLATRDAHFSKVPHLSVLNW